MKKTIIALLVIVLSLGAVLTGCGGETETSTDGKVKVTVAAAGIEQSDTDDEYFHNIVDRFDVEFEFITLSSDTAAEKARIMINSGDMPDMVKTNAFDLREYEQYATQGIIAPLPADWEEKYPDLAFAEAMTGNLDRMKALDKDGIIYGLSIPMDQYKSHVDVLREAHKNGENLVEVMNRPEYIPIDGYGFSFRKDWAEKLGIETAPIMEYDAFIDMVHKFKEADLGGVGADNVVGIAVDFTEACNIFVTAFNSAYNYFYIDEEKGEYVCGFLTDSTAEGVKAYAEAYRTGVLAKDFYTQKTDDLNSLFCSQRSGIIFPRGSLSYLKTLFRDFEAANPGLKGADCIDVCWLLSPDGTIHGRENGNSYGGYYFSPEITDVKMDKLLSVANFVCSEEGGPQVTLGIPEKDYTVDEEGNYVVTRPLNEIGKPKAMKDMYPSYEFFRQFINTHFYIPDQEDPEAQALSKKLAKAKTEYPLNLKKRDLDLNSYTGEEYVKFRAKYDSNQILADVVVSEGDIEEKWNKQVEEFRKEAEEVCAILNRDILGK